MRSGTHWLVSFQFLDNEPIGFLENSKAAATDTAKKLIALLGDKRHTLNVYKLNVVKNRIHPKRVKLDL
jgi:hypothetical protein